ncbi:substrate-binding domain-containing protein [Erythrobacter sanguineus]|jgi:phosphate transport system substrate-binding protein|uniref:Phosphate ABC transporter substrate-binding protein, PhoT family n=1 Tax=Erythrobacter sanguineus TaxID=198312 RepID=A0A1M7SKG8_9SPHN|nr:substrate-binding domain-containing protein [Erythrobacter sanguineus]SHN58957.1 phosphate ABC transporter substrate-binding protein, PhoT family [Erythrobacter sanguineus]
MPAPITTIARTGVALALAALTLSACDSGGGGARNSVHAVGSSTVYPFAKLVAESFSRSNTDFRSPLIESTGTGNGIQLFCKGLGSNTPDMVNASRRMKASEFERCLANKVDEIIELQVGLDGIAFASSQDGIMLNLSPRTVYEALAASPYGREQTAKTWADVDPALPADPILVYGPPSTSGTRDALKELVLEVGCASNPEMAALKKSDENRYKQVCTEVRDDGGYVDQGEQDNLIVQKIESNPRAVGIFGFSYLDENADKVQGLPMNGVQPTYDNIASFAYPGARPLYVYVKKAHMRAIPGLGAYMDEWAKSWKKDGPLARIGMVAMTPEAMEANLRKVREQIVLTREDLAAD